MPTDKEIDMLDDRELGDLTDRVKFPNETIDHLKGLLWEVVFPPTSGKSQGRRMLEETVRDAVYVTGSTETPVIEEYLDQQAKIERAKRRHKHETG